MGEKKKRKKKKGREIRRERSGLALR